MDGEGRSGDDGVVLVRRVFGVAADVLSDRDAVFSENNGIAGG
jgi:hypothetical protein